jgi:hypothetical protein
MCTNYLSHSRVPVEERNVLLCFSRSVLIEDSATELIYFRKILYFKSFNLRRIVC